MDVVERLSIEQAGAPTLLALTHVHRYELAAEACSGKRVLDLCCGTGYGSQILSRSASSVLGVDVDEEAVAVADDAFASESVAFERADAYDLLEQPLGERFDAIVLLEGIEHLADPERALEQLRRHADGGLTVVVSLPNSLTFGERNPHHVTDYDFETAMAAIARFGDPTVLFQFHAEGSLIRPLEGGSLQARSTLDERGEPEHCNHLIALVNADPEAAERAGARMQLAVAPTHNSYMLELERFNKELWRTNQRLARERLGVADSAAAARLAPRPRISRGAVALGAVLARVGKGVAALVLYILPHGLTRLVLEMRASRRERQG